MSFRIDFKVLLLDFKALNDLASEFFTECLSVYVPAGERRSADSGLLQIPSLKYRKHGETLLVIVSKLRNSFPRFIRQSEHNINT